MPSDGAANRASPKGSQILGSSGNGSGNGIGHYHGNTDKTLRFNTSANNSELLWSVPVLRYVSDVRANAGLWKHFYMLSGLICADVMY